MRNAENCITERAPCQDCKYSREPDIELKLYLKLEVCPRAQKGLRPLTKDKMQRAAYEEAK